MTVTYAKSYTYYFYAYSLILPRPKAPCRTPHLYLAIDLVRRGFFILKLISALLSVCDNIVKSLNNKYDIPNIEDSPFDNLLSLLFYFYGSRKEVYYGRELEDSLCSKFMSRMSRFCGSLFHTSCLNCRSMIREIPDLHQLEGGLLGLSEV